MPSLLHCLNITIIMSPSVIFPSTFDDVAAAVRRARSQGLDLSVRCGGHFTAPVASSVVIDLSRNLNSITIDAENKLAYVQGGCRFSQVEREATKFGEYLNPTHFHRGVDG